MEKGVEQVGGKGFGRERGRVRGTRMLKWLEGQRRVGSVVIECRIEGSISSEGE